jgi:putative Ca2+/H+ antiporter (TMEM165/GDT1 family)
MDALLLALVGCLIGEIGDKNQLLVLALATRFDRDGAVIAGVVAAAVANAALSATVGAFLGPMLSSDARLLFLALATIFMGSGLLWRVKAPDPLAGWRVGAFLTTFLGLFILGLGDGPQFLIMAIAARTGDPVLAGVGGAIGVTAAAVPVVLLRGSLLEALPVRALRLTSGLLLLLIGAGVGLSALGRL